jgi:hypothetical protein
MMSSGSLIERTVKYNGGTLEVYDSKIKTTWEVRREPFYFISCKVFHDFVFFHYNIYKKYYFEKCNFLCLFREIRGFFTLKKKSKEKDR